MKYRFFDNMKQRTAGFPFTVDFECDSHCGRLTVISHNAGEPVNFHINKPVAIFYDELEQLADELEMHLTGEAYLD